MTSGGGARDETDTAPPEPRTPAASPLAFRLFVASVVVAAVPTIVATVRALHRGWLPIGDDGFFAVRSFDVFGHHIPLLGTWSSSSLSFHTNLNNPGPLLFDMLAVPVRVLGGDAGLPVGVALVNIAALIGIAVFAYRRGGALVGTIAVTVTAALCWAMGSELLYDPWQPHSLLLPFLFFAVLVWSLACGDFWALPFVAFVGSLVLQTHLTYAVLVPVFIVFGLLMVGLGLRRERRRDPDRWPTVRRHSLVMSAVAGVVIVAAWTQTLIQQFTATGSGNLTRLVRTARNSQVPSVGYRLGARLAASVLSLPPWWFRPSVQHTFYLDWHPPSLTLAIGSLVVLAAVLGACGWDARRRHDRVSGLAVGTAGLALIGGLVTAAQSPITVFGVYTPHGFRFLWPLGAFVFFAILVSVARNVADRGVSTDALVGAFLVLAVVLGAINLPYANLGDGPNSQQWAIPGQRQLQQHLTGLTGHGALLVDDLFRTFADPHGPAVLAELQQEGVPFVARDATLVAQLGPSRRFNGHNATLALLLRTGDAALNTPPGSHRVGLGQGLSSGARRELLDLHAELATYLRQHGVPLNTRGTTELQGGQLASLKRLASHLGPGVDPGPLFTSRDLVTMIQHHDLLLDRAWSHRFQRYADLQHQWDRATVALFLAPIETAPKSKS